MDTRQLRKQVSALEHELKLCIHNYNFALAIKDSKEAEEYAIKIKSLNMELKLLKQTLLQRSTE
jgi:hypothetical protein